MRSVCNMRNFISSLLGALSALVLFFGAGIVLIVILLVVIGSMEQKTVAVERGSYLVFDLSANITDSPPLIDFGSFSRNHVDVLQLRQVTAALRTASTDDRIKGVLIIGSVRTGGMGSGYAALEEVRGALMDFRDSGKPVHAFLNYASTRDYYVASVADDIALDPYGALTMPGLASEPMFFAKAFEKYGIGVQVTRVGKYKSAVEPFIREDLSEENRQQMQQLLGGIWGNLIEDIGASRGLSIADIQKVVDTEGMIRAEQAKEAGLVDRVIYRDVILAELQESTGQKASKPFTQIGLQDYANLINISGSSGGGRIAVVYAEGTIVDGEGEREQIGGDRFSSELRRLRLDDSVSAIVLRVNSPGGSASASETIQREMRFAAKEKPVVVSMGSYAASGGYWISTYSERIYAEPMTITGSIGVFGVLFDIQKLANNMGITFDQVKTGEFADTMTISRPKTDAEMALIQRSVDWIYDEFISKVAESRAIPRAQVEEIAQGRVWSGQEALDLGLVDEIGGLDEAIKHAAKLAGLEKYRLVEYPRKKELAEAISELVNDMVPAGASAGLEGVIVEKLKGEMETLRGFNDPQGLYARMPMTLNLP